MTSRRRFAGNAKFYLLNNSPTILRDQKNHSENEFFNPK